MPLLNALEFTRDHLIVGYHATAQEQELQLDFKLKKRTKRPNAHGQLMGECWAIKVGLAGSDLFDPCAGQAEITSGPMGPPGIFGPSYRYVLKVKAVAPIYLRIVLEHLRAVGWDIPLASCSMTGSTPVDASEHSCTEANMRKWLDDPTAYPKPWPKLAFPHEVIDQQGRGLTVRATFQRALVPDARKAYETNWGTWRNACSTVVSPEGELVRVKLGQTLPVHAFAKREATTHIEVFERARPPCIALALNMLHRFHVEHSPIAAVEIKI